MGKFKTQKSNEMQTLRRAHKMAESFAVHKTKGFLDTFLKGSGLGDLLFGYYTFFQDHLEKDLNSKLLSLEAANVKGDQVAGLRLQTEIDDIKSNIDIPRVTAEKYLETLHEDLNIPFGGALALSYAMGYGDAKNGASLKTLYVPKQADEKSPLILPGLE